MGSNLGEIITFYSYKGGVGRSMALANVACLLTQKQDRDRDNNVLMIDWDLEAPGLHQFFHGRFIDNIDEKADLPVKQLRLIDLFYEIKNQLEKNISKNNTLEDVFKKIDIEKYIIKVNYPSLYLMPAGKFEDGLYSSRVNQFDWVDFFDKYPSTITQFADHLRKKYKYVLIDSRTGYTDTSGICTSIMPEKLVTVFTPNRQSLAGIVEMIRRATEYRKQSDDLRPLMIFPLPSRIENAESELKEEWRFGNSEHLGYQPQLESVFIDVYGLKTCDLTKYFDEYLLQYVPRYSYGEELTVFSERIEERLSLARSFENFTEKIISSENSWQDVKNPDFNKEDVIKDTNENSWQDTKNPDIYKEDVQKYEELIREKSQVKRTRAFSRLTVITFIFVVVNIIFIFILSSNLPFLNGSAAQITETIQTTSVHGTSTAIIDLTTPTLTSAPLVPLGKDWIQGCISTVWSPYPKSIIPEDRGDGCWREPIHAFSAENGNLDFLYERQSGDEEIYGLFAPLPESGAVTVNIRLRELTNTDLWIGIFPEPDVNSQGLLMIMLNGSVARNVFILKDPLSYETI